MTSLHQTPQTHIAPAAESVAALFNPAGVQDAKQVESAGKNRIRGHYTHAAVAKDLRGAATLAAKSAPAAFAHSAKAGRRDEVEGSNNNHTTSNEIGSDIGASRSRHASRIPVLSERAGDGHHGAEHHMEDSGLAAQADKAVANSITANSMAKPLDDDLSKSTAVEGVSTPNAGRIDVTANGGVDGFGSGLRKVAEETLDNANKTGKQSAPGPIPAIPHSLSDAVREMAPSCRDSVASNESLSSVDSFGSSATAVATNASPYGFSTLASVVNDIESGVEKGSTGNQATSSETESGNEASDLEYSSNSYTVDEDEEDDETDNEELDIPRLGERRASTNSNLEKYVHTAAASPSNNPITSVSQSNAYRSDAGGKNSPGNGGWGARFTKGFIGTPWGSSPSNDVYGEQALLPELAKEDIGKKCLVLDLDETLVHSSFKAVEQADFIIPVEIDDIIHNVFVMKRPGVDTFLQRLGDLYEIVVFTASLAKYADPVLDELDKHRVVKHRLFREACVQHKGNFVKDLSILGRNIKDVIIIDNSPASYIFHPMHAVPVSSWFNDPDDGELLDLLPFLEDLSIVDDVAMVLDNNNDPSMETLIMLREQQLQSFRQRQRSEAEVKVQNKMNYNQGL